MIRQRKMQTRSKKDMTVSFNYHSYMNIDNTTHPIVEETDVPRVQVTGPRSHSHEIKGKGEPEL